MATPLLTITFLGTGTSSGVPMIACDCRVCTSNNSKDKRLRSSIMIQSATTTIVVDTTPDFRYQMLRNKVKKLDAILFTHPHKDHIAGLDDVKAFNYFSKKTMPLYANTLTEDALRREFYYAFSDKKYPGVPELEMNTIDTTSFLIGDIPIQPFIVWHLKMPVFAFKFGGFTYITDANKIDEHEKELIKNSKVLVLNALRKEKHLSHFTLDEATHLANELNAKQTYFTHISHQLGLHDTINNQLPTHIQLAYDGLQFQV
ncbi:MAG: MBL fold metallo-hydrolase [Chitinophagales bacterium]|nr:MBL fold metallo-hydrolase [Chitinophagales bacterium]